MPLILERNDLATMEADAIVVTANEDLRITGGVGLSVAQTAGLERMQRACDALGHCLCGSAVATPAFDLPAKMVIHAVGPVWQGGAHGEEGQLRSAYDAALACAAAEGARSVALPLISAGSYGFPPAVSLSVARQAISAFLEDHDLDVHLVLYDKAAMKAALAPYERIAEYIDDHYVEEHPPYGTRRLRGMPLFAPAAPASDEAPAPAAPAPDEALAPDEAGAVFSDCNLRAMLNDLDAPFSPTLLALIDARSLTDVQVYKRANMSRQLFSKIRSDASYRPTKKTVLALAIALELSLEETRDLLARAGFALSHSSKADVIVEYHIVRGIYDIFAINEALFAFDQPLL